MKVLILAGGFGTRISEYTHSIPKPMVRIGEKPILWHIMNHYSQFGHQDFFLALGYKAELVKEYFLNYSSLYSNFSVDVNSGKFKTLDQVGLDWKVTAVDTGLNTMTGGRVKRMRDYIGNETFLLTYGDALGNINIDELIKFHQDHGKMVSVTAVHPNARFGELNIQDNQVLTFAEKPNTKKDWVNGGFFVINKEFFDLIKDGDKTILERSPLEEAARLGELMAYKHDDYWQCMDTKRDHDLLEKLWQSGEVPWKI
tara:strand:- start:7980 stop:8747 length:768 start_codon:yes stop_codon:yes gene_type:complete